MNTSTQEVITQVQKTLKDIVHLPAIELTQEQYTGLEKLVGLYMLAASEGDIDLIRGFDKLWDSKVIVKHEGEQGCIK